VKLWAKMKRGVNAPAIRPFRTARAGLAWRSSPSGSGASTSISFDADPVSCTSQKDRDDSVYLEVRPLTGPPCEWAWELDEQ